MKGKKPDFGQPMDIALQASGAYTSCGQVEIIAWSEDRQSFQGRYQDGTCRWFTLDEVTLYVNLR